MGPNPYDAINNALRVDTWLTSLREPDPEPAPSVSNHYHDVYWDVIWTWLELFDRNPRKARILLRKELDTRDFAT